MSSIDTSELITNQSIQDELNQFFEEEEIIQEEISEEIFSPPFRVTNIPIEEYCGLDDITNMQIVEVDVDPPPLDTQVLLGIKDSIEGSGIFSHLFLANRQLMIPHIIGATPLVFIRNTNDKLINSGFELREQFEVEGTIYTLFCYIPFISGKKIFGFGTTNEYFYEQAFFSVGFCKENESIPTFEIPPIEFRDQRLHITDTDKIICSNTSARFRKMSSGWNSIKYAIIDLNEMLFSTIDPNYMEKIMRLNMFFTVPNAQING